MNIQNIRKIITKGNVYTDEPMSRHTTYRVGGPAKVFIEPFSEEELSRVLRYFTGNQIPYVIIGNGSNLLVSDRGFEGAVIHLGRVDGSDFVMLGYEDREDSILFDAGCGCLMSALGTFAERLGCTGFEPLSGIPGCIGGATVMNAGAYGTELGDLICGVTAMEASGKRSYFSADELRFYYRGSSLAENGMIVLRTVYVLKKESPELISSLMKEYAVRRKEKQPLEYPSAGSVFKRPEGCFAGRLIEDSGLKGFQTGGAAVSEKHAGFIINTGNASAQDIYHLIRHIQKTVSEKYQVELIPEVKMIGEFQDER